MRAARHPRFDDSSDKAALCRAAEAADATVTPFPAAGEVDRLVVRTRLKGKGHINRVAGVVCAAHRAQQPSQ